LSLNQLRMGGGRAEEAEIPHSRERRKTICTFSSMDKPVRIVQSALPSPRSGYATGLNDTCYSDSSSLEVFLLLEEVNQILLKSGLLY